MRVTLLLIFQLFLARSVFLAQNATAGGILYETGAQPSYSDPEQVELEWWIVNKSPNAIVVPWGMNRIKLIGPDGNPVSPYPHHVSGRNTRSFGIYCYPPGGRHEQKMRLSSIFPFPLEGEYRCILTQRVYQWNAPEAPEDKKLYDDDYFGTPVDLTAHEVRFRVNSPSNPERLKPKLITDPDVVLSADQFNGMGTTKFPPLGERRFWKPAPESAGWKKLIAPLFSTGLPTSETGTTNAHSPAFSSWSILALVLLGLSMALALWWVKQRTMRQ